MRNVAAQGNVGHLIRDADLAEVIDPILAPPPVPVAQALPKVRLPSARPFIVLP